MCREKIAGLGCQAIMALMVMILVGAGTIKAQSYFTNEFHDLNNDSVPPGWTLQAYFGPGGIQDGRLEADVPGAQYGLRRVGQLLFCDTGITLEWDANLSYSYWGITTDLEVFTPRDTIVFSTSMSQYDVQLVRGGDGLKWWVRVYGSLYDWHNPRTAILDTVLPLVYGTYHYTVKLSEGAAEFKGVNLTDPNVKFDFPVIDTGFHLSQLSGMEYHAYTTTDTTSWVDNIGTSVTPGPACSVDSLMFRSSRSDSIAACSLSTTAAGLQPIVVKTDQPSVGVGIAGKIPPGFTIDSVSLTGKTRNWLLNFVSKTDSGFYQVLLSQSSGARLPADTNTIAYLHFTCSPARQSVHWDTALSGDVARRSACSDTLYQTHFLAFNRNSDSSEITPYNPGDLNCDGRVDLGDLSALVSYLTGGGFKPCTSAMADVAASGVIDLSDLSKLVAWLTGSPVTLQCGWGKTNAAAPKVAQEIAVSTSFRNGVTTVTLSSPYDLRAAQFVIKGAQGDVSNPNPDKFDLLSGNPGGNRNVILIDLKGRNLIENGTHTLLQILGKCEIASASVSDIDFETQFPVINVANKLNELPESFSLEQNYPNPFNPTTTISFSLPKATSYTLTIYNVAGQVVKEFNGAAGPGTIHQVWDASKNASGVYFYRLTAGEFVQNKKMMLLK